MGFLKTIKDDTVSFLGKQAINLKMKRYGEMMDFQIDSENKRILLKVSLKGEPEPLIVTVNKYEIMKVDGKDFLIIRNVTTSKEWMNLIAEDFMKDKEVELPDKFSRIIKMIME